MPSSIANTLCEIEFLMSKKNIAKRDLLSKNEYIDLLIQIKTQYDVLASLYTDKEEKLFALQALLCGTNILFEICELDLDIIENQKLYNLRDYLLETARDCYDLDLSRNAFVTIGQLSYYLGDYITAEEYIQKAFNDYDYSVSTFQLYMKVLDKNHKYEKMLTLMENYLSMSIGFHDKCSIKDFHVPNILHSSYASAYERLFY